MVNKPWLVHHHFGETKPSRLAAPLEGGNLYQRQGGSTKPFGC